MAIKWPLANGVWSNAANWNDGTLPDVGDDVHADGKTVTIDQDVTVLSVRTTQRSGGTNGGSFVHSGGFILTADVLIQVNNTINNFSNNSQIVGNINVSSSAVAVNNGITANGDAKITGNVFSGGVSCVPVSKTGGGKLEIIGNIVGDGNSSTCIIHASTSNGSEVEITGNLSGGSINLSNAFLINNSSGNSISKVTGNVIGANANVNNSHGISVTSSFASLTVIGTSTGGNSAVGINVSGAATVTLDKAIGSELSTASVAGINCSSATAVVTVKELEYGSNGQTPATGFIRFSNTINNKVIVRKVDNTNLTLIDINDASVYLPAESDVRQGVLYAPDLDSEGTLEVPDPSNVRKGVPTDNTVGTAELTGEDILNAILTSENPVAERLRNVSTVQTTGDQIAGS
jgi:hypothetical protein